MTFKKQITRSIAIAQTPRVLQMSGMFDVPRLEKSTQTWNVNVQLPSIWNVGVIVGPSGSGKSTIAGELLAQHLVAGHDWPRGKSILDGFPKSLGIKDITGLLCSVGFSSPPAWLRPFHCLSNGQQFRVNLARTLAEATVDKQIKVVDEYSSVVDRTVARIGSAAVAKTVRRFGLQFVAVTCHADVLDWLEPDWVFDVENNKLLLNESPDNARAARSVGSTATPVARGLLRREGKPTLRWNRPPINLKIVPAHRSAWARFHPHHYLSSDLNKSAQCFLALVEDQPAAFTAVLPFPHPHRPSWREHRTVCLPDFQGVGIGNAMSEFVASLFAATGKPYKSTTSHPAMIRHRAKSPLWRMLRKPGLMHALSAGITGMAKTVALDRLTAGFEYVGPTRPNEARRFGLRFSPVESAAAG